MTVHALGRTWITMPINASDIELLQPAPSLVNNGKVLSYTLAARTATGVVTLPMKSDSAAQLLPPPVQWQQLAGLGRTLKRLGPQRPHRICTGRIGPECRADSEQRNRQVI